MKNRHLDLVRHSGLNSTNSLAGTNDLVIVPTSPFEEEQRHTPPKSNYRPPKLYVDRLLENRDTHGIGELRFEACIIKVSKLNCVARTSH